MVAHLAGGHGGPPLVRLKACLTREVKVLSRYTLSGLKPDCNCVAMRRGGEQQGVKDQSVG